MEVELEAKVAKLEVANISMSSAKIIDLEAKLSEQIAEVAELGAKLSKNGARIDELEAERYENAKAAEHKAEEQRARKADRTVVLHHVDMAEDMQQQAIDFAMQALEKHSSNSSFNMPRFIREKFESLHGPRWEVVVGESFDSSGSLEKNHYIGFSVGQWCIEVFNA